MRQEVLIRVKTIGTRLSNALSVLGSSPTLSCVALPGGRWALGDS